LTVAKKSLVLVDDEKDILELMKRGLEQNNYEVHAFTDPVEALEFIRSTHSPQMLITDVHMSAMTGFELARHVCAHNPDMMIVFVTAFEINKSEFEKVFPSARVDALIQKPASITKLVDAVNALFVGKYSKD